MLLDFREILRVLREMMDSVLSLESQNRQAIENTTIVDEIQEFVQLICPEIPESGGGMRRAFDEVIKNNHQTKLLSELFLIAAQFDEQFKSEFYEWRGLRPNPLLSHFVDDRPPEPLLKWSNGQMNLDHEAAIEELGTAIDSTTIAVAVFVGTSPPRMRKLVEYVQKKLDDRFILHSTDLGWLDVCSYYLDEGPLNNFTVMAAAKRAYERHGIDYHIDPMELFIDAAICDIDLEPLSDSDTSKGRWFDRKPLEGSEYAHGPLSGRLQELVQWINQGTSPTLKKNNGRSSYYIHKVVGQQFDAWFNSQCRYEEAVDRKRNESD